MRCKNNKKGHLNHSRKTVLQLYHSVPHSTLWAGELYSSIKSKSLDEMGTLVCREAVPAEGEVGDLGQWPPEPSLNQTMTAARRSHHISSPCKQSTHACMENKSLSMKKMHDFL